MSEEGNKGKLYNCFLLA